MKDLLLFLAKSLAEHPEAVSVEETVDDDGTIVYDLTVSSGDMGRVIGKGGRIAKAIRTVMKSAAAREGKRVVVNIR